MAENRIPLPRSIQIRITAEQIRSLLASVGVVVGDAIGERARGQTPDWGDIGRYVPIDAAGAQFTNLLEDSAWTLITRGLAFALGELTGELLGHSSAGALSSGADVAARILTDATDLPEITVDQRFLRAPGNHPFIGQAKEAYAAWLKLLGIDRQDATNTADRLPAYFTYALMQEWTENLTEYKKLWEASDNPLSRAAGQQLSWDAYLARLQREPEERLFHETFSVAKVYIPIRAWRRLPSTASRKPQGRHLRGLDTGHQDAKERRLIVDVEDDLVTWATTPKPDGDLRVISGGPGQGKSTLMRKLAARLAADGKRVLLIPLHRLSDDGLKTAITTFARNGANLHVDPLDDLSDTNPLILIFDGLDELERQGEAGGTVAKAFAESVVNLLRSTNIQAVKLRAIITGRNLVVDALAQHLHKSGRVLHLLTYAPLSESENQADWYKVDISDPERLGDLDQRAVWWRKYGQAVGEPYEGMPFRCGHGDLEALTHQPLLNYLIALTYRDENSKVDLTKVSNLNEVYADLIRQTYERTWAKGDAPHAALGDVTLPEFTQFLEEVAVAAWHGEGRSTTIPAVAKRIEAGPSQHLLSKFKEGRISGVARLLTAFYFKSTPGRVQTEGCFEFTHKSFREYLTARAIVRQVEMIDEEINRREKRQGRGLTNEQAVGDWLRLCGPEGIDRDLLQYLVDEVKLRGLENGQLIASWRDRFTELFRWSLSHGAPLDTLGHITSFRNLTRFVSNGEVALLAVSHATTLSQFTRRRLESSKGELLEWLRRVEPHPAPSRLPVVTSCLIGADLSSADLSGADLSDANLSDANLSSADLSRADLRGADLRGADLRGANLIDAYLRSADLSNSHLKGAGLIDADLSSADLSGADLSDANLSSADLASADLSSADLSSADLRGTNLEDILYNDKTTWPEGFTPPPSRKQPT